MLKKTCIALLTAGALFATQAGAAITQSDDEAFVWDESSYHSGPQQLTVLNPDGSSYSLTPVGIEMEIAMLEPILQLPANEPLPDQLTVFEPSGVSYTYEFTLAEGTTPFDIVALEDGTLILPLALSDDGFMVIEDENSLGSVALNNDQIDLHPIYIVQLISPPSYSVLPEDESTG